MNPSEESPPPEPDSRQPGHSPDPSELGHAPDSPNSPGRPDTPDTSNTPDSERPIDLVRTGLWFYGAMALAAVIWRVGLYGEPMFYASLEAEARGPSVLRDTLLGLFVGGWVVAFSYALTKLTSWGDRLARQLAEMVGSMSVPDALLMAVASGFAEEMFFRGALQPRVGWVAAGVLFGLVHFVPRREMAPWTGFAIASGLLFGWMFEWTGNLVAPVVAHAVVNGVNLPLLIQQYRDDGGGEDAGDESP